MNNISNKIEKCLNDIDSLLDNLLKDKIINKNLYEFIKEDKNKYLSLISKIYTGGTVTRKEYDYAYIKLLNILSFFSFICFNEKGKELWNKYDIKLLQLHYDFSKEINYTSCSIV